jgi:hypothetical protein
LIFVIKRQIRIACTLITVKKYMGGIFMAVSSKAVSDKMILKVTSGTKASIDVHEPDETLTPEKIKTIPFLIENYCFLDII